MRMCVLGFDFVSPVVFSDEKSAKTRVLATSWVRIVCQGRPYGEMSGDPIRIEDYMSMFPAECGGVVVGELGKVLRGAECGAEMDAFVNNVE
jgi:hypothetical protein